MRWTDLLQLALRSLITHRMRSALTLGGIAVGIAAVILLTSIGEGLHRFVLQEFGQFGTNVIEITPGRQGPRGGPPGLPTTARELTLDDAAALARLPHVRHVTGNVSGNAEVRANGRVRRTMVLGVGAHMHEVYKMRVRVGQFLPPDDSDSPRAFVVLGPKLKRELFDAGNALGERVQIGDERYRVIGIMEEKGQFLGIDLDDTAFIPSARGLALFNRDGLMEIGLDYEEQVPAVRVVEQVKRTLIARHGREDFTIRTQEDMLATLSNILGILTAAVGALGGISLLVGGVGIVTIMTIAVSERTNEIGLLVALGARRRTILVIFLGEAVVLAALGGLLGLLVGAGLAQLVGVLLPAMPVATPWQFVLIAELLAVVIGLAAGVLPARRAAGLNAVDALRAE
ncbi:ABC transporter permease [Thauera sp. WH-1]|uniref:ABC transporter permease n=1 Tax=Thauera sp. WH-1 TaxID=3398230 RepID=UPI0039FBCB36